MRKKRNIGILLMAAALLTGCENTAANYNMATQSQINDTGDSENMSLGNFFGKLFDPKKDKISEKEPEANTATSTEKENVVIFGEKEKGKIYEYDTPVLPADAPDAKVNGQEIKETASSVPTNLPDSPDAAWEMQNSADLEGK